MKLFLRKCLLLFTLLLVVIIYCLQVNEHFDYSFILPFSSSKDKESTVFKINEKNNDFILDFSKLKDTEKLKQIFTTESYSGLNKDENDVEYSFSQKLNNQIWSGTVAEYDPTGGNVKYENEFNDNKINSLIKVDNNMLNLELGEPDSDESISKFIGQSEFTSKNIYPSRRLTSKNTFSNKKQHLFILKAKLPFGKALWPAWWLAGTSGKQDSLNKEWPTNGEIDIIELVNEESSFKNVLHMCKKCKSRWKKGPKMGSNSNDWGKITQCQGEWNNGGCFSGDVYNIKNSDGELPNPNFDEDKEVVTAPGDLYTLNKLNEGPEDQRGGIFACYWNPKGEKNVKLNEKIKESYEDESNQDESNQDESNQDESNEDESNQDESNQDESNNKTVDILGNIKFYYWDYEETKNISDSNGPLSDKPDPSKWSKNLLSEVEYWEGEKVDENQVACKEANNITCQFNEMKMVFNTTLCGDWAGNGFPDGGMDKCRSYLTSNSKDIVDKKWNISYIAAFSKDL